MNSQNTVKTPPMTRSYKEAGHRRVIYGLSAGYLRVILVLDTDHQWVVMPW